jgi:hypothetical protein
MKRQVADRLFLVGVCILAVCTAFFEPTSTSYTMVRIGGWPARVCMAVLVGLSILALADTIVNDMLPEPYVFKTGWKFRQGIWMLIAVTFTGTSFVTIRLDGGMLLAAMQLLYGLRCAGVSFLDLYYEHRDAIRGRRSTDFGAL